MLAGILRTPSSIPFHESLFIEYVITPAESITPTCIILASVAAITLPNIRLVLLVLVTNTSIALELFSEVTETATSCP